MGTVTLDSVTYETDLLSDEGRAIVSHLEKSLREASITVGLMQAATVALLSDLKSNHLTEEALSTEEVETIEE